MQQEVHEGQVVQVVHEVCAPRASQNSQQGALEQKTRLDAKQVQEQLREVVLEVQQNVWKA